MANQLKIEEFEFLQNALTNNKNNKDHIQEVELVSNIPLTIYRLIQLLEVESADRVDGPRRRGEEGDRQVLLGRH